MLTILYQCIMQITISQSLCYIICTEENLVILNDGSHVPELRVRYGQKTDKFRLSEITGIFPVFASALRRSSFGGGIIPEMGWKRSQHQKLCAICAFSDKRNS